MASISVRESIRWMPEEAHEPTSTIVLTSPGKRFVDLRIMNQRGVMSGGSEDKVSLKRLDWGIAGTSSSVLAPEKGPKTKFAQWSHWIDSRTLDVENAMDEGYMSPLGRVRTLETGSMAHPETGIVTDYEEIWVDEEPRPVPSDDGQHIVVLEFEGQGEGAGPAQRGRVVKLGRLCQGLLRDGDTITAERWEWNESKGWRRTKVVGDVTGLPCRDILDNWTGSEGGSLELDGRTWKVIEAISLWDD